MSEHTEHASEHLAHRWDGRKCIALFYTTTAQERERGKRWCGHGHTHCSIPSKGGALPESLPVHLHVLEGQGCGLEEMGEDKSLHRRLTHRTLHRIIGIVKDGESVRLPCCP